MRKLLQNIGSTFIKHFQHVSTECMSEVELQLPLGRIKGLRRKTVYDETYTGFEGIPYAKAPLGSLRFKPAQPAEPWSGLRDCTEFNVAPCQADRGSEDCLYLNVYAKTLESSRPLPVMVFLYGGGFRGGDGTRAHYGPDYFMFENVILVTLNYRLSTLGFLSLSDPELQVPGNAGLKDQVLALQWIRDNIAHFNGDCNNVTLFGESAGAVCVHLLMASQMASGLFHKAILMSGCAFNNWGCMPQGDAAYRLALCHGYQGENKDKPVFEYLCQLEPSKLVSYQFIDEKAVLNDRLFTFVPTVEPYADEQCLIDKSPLELLKSAWGNNIPTIIGGTSFEGMVIKPFAGQHPNVLDMAQNQPMLLVPKDVKDVHTAEENHIMGETLHRLHFGEDRVYEDPMRQFLDFCSYKFFWHGLDRAVRSRLSYGAAPTYVYRFDFDSPFFNFYRIKFCGPEWRGVSHADTLAYLFYLQRSFKLSPELAEYQTIRRMVSMWTSFAANADPNCDAIKTVNWKPVCEDDSSSILNIGHNIEIIELPEKKRLDVWSSLYQKTPLF